ncbi:NAD(P)-dependent oxidoreductase [Danxiaibacter flavus]|uniref:NAD(P)-dependent oxidoreductase n=1 Tax=Danxiaibacter flavus TaxID=3049108 RepID=A0ABV3Z9X3_9BACT|nr:NAD(P)-dependent oxidoreductase [Chitinophagaceae bacterium DXS]
MKKVRVRKNVIPHHKNQCMKIGFIGLGNLGTPIAENLLEKRKELYVYNRTAAKAQHLIAKGATLCQSVKELASLCDIVISIVSDDAAINNITQGENGIAANLKAEGIHISMSTILPATSIALAQLHQQHNNNYITAPILGRPEAAKARKLNFLVSGNEELQDVIEPILHDAGAVNIWTYGEDAGAANTAKLCSNYLIVSAIQAMSEGISLARHSGIDAEQWMNMLTQTIFAAPAYINYGNLLLKEAYQPAAFSLKLALKDVNLVAEQASETQANMPLGKLLQQQMNKCIEKGMGDYDVTALALALS